MKNPKIDFNCPYCGDYSNEVFVENESDKFFFRCKNDQCRKVYAVSYSTHLTVLIGKIEWDISE